MTRAGPPAPTVAAAAHEFQGPLDQLVLEPAPRILTAWPFLAASMLAALGLLAAVLPVDVTVVATGRIAADAPPIMLKPMARAVLSELRVKPGDRVTRGQILARLDGTMTAADQAALRAEASAIAAEIARRDAEISGNPVGQDEGANGIPALRLAEIRAEEEALQRNIAGMQASLAIETGLVANLEDQLRIAAEVETIRRDLATRKTGSELEAKAATSARLGAEVALLAARARQAELTRHIAAQADQLALNAARRKREAAEALAALHLRAEQIAEALQKADRLATLAVLTAPRDGTVVSVAPGGPGAVIAEGETLLSLVPSDAGLVAEVTLDSASIGRVAVGDPVRVKIDAFPWRRSGEAEGVVESISPLSFEPEHGGSARHPLRIRLTTLPDRLGSPARLTPGMTLTADIEIGTRSVLDFFIDPLARGLSESLREP